MRSKKAGPGRPSLHQTFASGGRPFLPPRATPLRFFRQAFLQKRPSPRAAAPFLPHGYIPLHPPHLCSCALPLPYNSVPPVAEAIRARQCPFLSLALSRGIRRRNGRGGGCRIHTFAPPRVARSCRPAFFRRRAFAGFSPGLFAKRPLSPAPQRPCRPSSFRFRRAPDDPPVPATSVLFCPPAGLAQQNRHNRKKAASVPETAFSGAKIPRSRIKVRSAGSRRQSVSASPPTHR